MIELPPYIDPDAWDAFVKMRASIKKPLTERGARRILNRLKAIHEAGQDPNESLDQSADMRWQDVYPVKAMDLKPSTASDYKRTMKMLSENREATRPPPGLLEDVRARLRRVA